MSGLHPTKMCLSPAEEQTLPTTSGLEDETRLSRTMDLVHSSIKRMIISIKLGVGRPQSVHLEQLKRSLHRFILTSNSILQDLEATRLTRLSRRNLLPRKSEDRRELCVLKPRRVSLAQLQLERLKIRKRRISSGRLSVNTSQEVLCSNL